MNNTAVSKPSKTMCPYFVALILLNPNGDRYCILLWKTDSFLCFLALHYSFTVDKDLESCSWTNRPFMTTSILLTKKTSVHTDRPNYSAHWLFWLLVIWLETFHDGAPLNGYGKKLNNKLTKDRRIWYSSFSPSSLYYITHMLVRKSMDSIHSISRNRVACGRSITHWI